MIKYIVLVWVVIAFSASGKESKSYTVVLYHKANPPYSFYDGNEHSGIFFDTFQQISEITGLSFDFVSLSVARGMLYFNQGVVDIEPGINPIWRKGEAIPGLYSVSYAHSTEVVLSRSGVEHRNIESLYGKVIGKVRGYRYGKFENHFGEDKIKTVDNTSEKLLMEQLYRGRFDYIMIGRASAMYYAFTDNKYANFDVVYDISKLPVSMRVQPGHKKVLEKINVALKVMKESGAIERIYRKNGATSQ